MTDSKPQDVRFYSGIAPTRIENHKNQGTEQLVNKINEEIKCKQAYVRVEFLKNTLERHNNELTQPEKNALNAELSDAQRELALLKQQLCAKYGQAKVSLMAGWQ